MRVFVFKYKFCKSKCETKSFTKQIEGGEKLVSVNEEALKQIRSHLLSCPVCKRNEFQANGTLQTTNNIDEKGGLQIGAGMPFIVVFCNNCGYSLPFLASKYNLR